MTLIITDSSLGGWFFLKDEDGIISDCESSHYSCPICKKTFIFDSYVHLILRLKDLNLLDKNYKIQCCSCASKRS